MLWVPWPFPPQYGKGVSLGNFAIVVFCFSRCGGAVSEAYVYAVHLHFYLSRIFGKYLFGNCKPFIHRRSDAKAVAPYYVFDLCFHFVCFYVAAAVHAGRAHAFAPAMLRPPISGDISPVGKFTSDA